MFREMAWPVTISRWEARIRSAPTIVRRKRLRTGFDIRWDTAIASRPKPNIHSIRGSALHDIPPAADAIQG